MSRAMGNAVHRNLMKRRLREAVRLQFSTLPGGFSIVLNARKPLLEADFDLVKAEIAKVFGRCRPKSGA